jgi:hypothetical protein
VFSVAKASTVVSEFKVPALKCTPVKAGVAPGSFMITGTSTTQHFNGAGVLTACLNGSEAAAADVIVNNAETLSTHGLFAGDLFKATVTTSATKTISTVSDITPGHTFTFTKSGPGALSLQETVMDDSVLLSGMQIPVANFGTIGFSAGTVGGKALGAVPSTKARAFNMTTAATPSVLEILTGGLTGIKKDSFVTTWKHL